MYVTPVQRKFLGPVLALLQFCTVLPLGAPQDFEQFGRRSYLYPIAGYVTGGIAGGVAFLIPDPSIRAAVALAALLLVTGCNHLDGLLDFGDGLMAHGSREKRVQALTDRQIGAGGVAMGVTVLLLAYSALVSVPHLFWAVLAAEVFAKYAMAALTAWGKPFREGIQSYLHGFSKPAFPVYAAVFCLPLLLTPIGWTGLAAAAGATLAALTLMLLLARRLFGGVNGDVVGATGMITFALVLVVLALAGTGAA